MSNERDKADEALRRLYRRREHHSALAENVRQRVAATSAVRATGPSRRLMLWSALAASTALAVATVTFWPFSTPSQNVSTNGDRPIVADGERGSVLLRIPRSSSSQADMSQRPIDMKVSAPLVVLGTIGDSLENGEAQLIELKIDRVLKGPTKQGRILTKDELPSFSCRGDAGPKASELFKAGTEVVIYLGKTQQADEWRLIAIHRRTKRFVDLYEVAQGMQPIERLPELLSGEAGGLDEDAQFILRAFPHPRTSPVLLEIVEQSLESFKALPAGQKLQDDALKREQSYMCCLDQLNEVFRGRRDARPMDAILDCLEELEDEGLSQRRFALVRLLRYWPVKCAADRFPRARRLLIDAIGDADALSPTTDMGAWRNYHNTVEGLLSILARYADSEAVDALLREQAKRPITGKHSLIADGLGKVAWVSEEDRLRITRAWMQILREFGTVGNRPVEQRFLDSVLAQLGRLPAADTIDVLLGRLAARPITNQHASTVKALDAIVREADEEDRLRIGKALLKALAELQSNEEGRGEYEYYGSLFSLLGRFADSEIVDVLLREQAKRPLTAHHSRIASALSFAAQFGKEEDRQRIKRAWIQAWSQRDSVKAVGYSLSFYRTVLDGFAQVTDAEIIDMLLRDQAKRPITRYHEFIVDRLRNSLRWIPEATQLRIKQRWLQTVLEFRPTDTDNQYEEPFVEALLRGLEGRLDDQELAKLRALRDREPEGWFRNRLGTLLDE